MNAIRNQLTAVLALLFVVPALAQDASPFRDLDRYAFGYAYPGSQLKDHIYQRSRQFPNLAAEGVSCHIGSQILDPAPILEAVDKVLALAARFAAEDHPIRHVFSSDTVVRS